MPPSPIKKSYTSRLSQDWPSCFVENESLNLFTTVTTFTEFVVYTVLLFIQSCCLHSPACPTKKDQIQDNFFKTQKFLHSHIWMLNNPIHFANDWQQQLTLFDWMIRAGVSDVGQQDSLRLKVPHSLEVGWNIFCFG